MSFEFDRISQEAADREEYEAWERSQSRPLEHCLSCGEPTGKAGRSDGSLYCEDCEQGPFCEECMEAHIC